MDPLRFLDHRLLSRIGNFKTLLSVMGVAALLIAAVVVVIVRLLGVAGLVPLLFIGLAATIAALLLIKRAVLWWRWRRAPKPAEPSGGLSDEQRLALAESIGRLAQELATFGADRRRSEPGWDFENVARQSQHQNETHAAYSERFVGRIRALADEAASHGFQAPPSGLGTPALDSRFLDSLAGPNPIGERASVLHALGERVRRDHRPEGPPAPQPPVSSAFDASDRATITQEGGSVSGYERVARARDESEITLRNTRIKRRGR